MKRPPKINDIDAIYSIYMHEEVNPFLTYNLMPIEEFRKVFSEDINQIGWYVYLEAAEIAGFYKITRFKGKCDHIVQIGSLAIAPKHFGKGVAVRMMTELIADFKAQGLKRIELIAESDNPRAIKFYEKLGFQKEGTLRNYCQRGSKDSFVDDYMMSIIVDTSQTQNGI